MKDARLRMICLWIAAFAGGVSIASILFVPIRLILYPATFFVGGTAALLFLRMLFSRTYRRGVDAANKEMQGDAPWPGKPRKFGDPDWGLFGIRTGTPALLWLRTVLVLGILPVALFHNWIGMEVVALWFAGALVTMELSVMYVALSEPR